ncbi:MAG: Ig-like domain-containing protein, partial [Chitinophagaceae bacterium]
MKKFISASAAILFLTAALTAQTSLINYGTSWKYLDNGSDQGTSWSAVSFNDAAWASGNAQLGYGDGDEATVVSFGSNSKKKYITTYFRKTFTVTNAASFSSFILNIKRDDGAVVYINGTEVFRTNMPTGSINFTSKASTDASDDGSTPQTISLPAGTCTEGSNVIAVEIHQFSGNNPDISFDLELTGPAADITPPVITNFSPADNATNISAAANLVLTFNETVQKGVGNILIKEGGTTTQTIDVNTTSVTVAGNTVTINPADFTPGAAVNIEMPAGIFKDIANNNYAGIANATTWNFTVSAPDVTAPVVTNYSPADNATNVVISTNLILSFSETVQKGVGNILIKTGGVTTQTIDVTSGLVTVAGNTVTINPADFAYNAAINIEMPAGTIKDVANNNYAGMTNATTWDFTTEAQPTGPQTLVAYGTSWKYLDNGSNQGTAWKTTAFNDATWASGNAELGYGDGDEATVISFGSNSNKKYITTYFRKTFTVTNAASFSLFTLNIKRDDGAVVYINGTEVFRTNMPTGTISYTSKASTDASDDGNTPQTISLPAGTCTEGNNIIAVEIHQFSGNNPDISFDLELTGPAADVTPPLVTNYSPGDNATNISAAANLVLTFNEPVQKGVGNILIKEGGSTTQTIDVNTAAVTIAGNTFTINPADFTPGAAVNIEMPAGTFKDVANNNYAGITNATTWNFTISAPDVTAPVVTNYSPADNATNISAVANLILTFNEPVQKGVGNILIKEGGSTTQTIGVNTAAVTIAGN